MPSHCQRRFCDHLGPHRPSFLQSPQRPQLPWECATSCSAAHPRPPTPMCLNPKVPPRLLCQELPCSTRPGCSIPSFDREPSSPSEGRGRGRDFCLGRVQGSAPGFESTHISFMTLVCFFFCKMGQPSPALRSAVTVS